MLSRYLGSNGQPGKKLMLPYLGSIPEAERAALGIGENLIRLSVGIEDTEDLVKDVEQALEAAVGKVVSSETC